MASTAQNPTMELDPKYDDYDFPTTSPEAGEGHPGHLTSSQQAQVSQLRLLLEAEGHTQRLDTLTLVWLSPPLGMSLWDRTLTSLPFSCVSCEPESSTWNYPRRCEP
jgi:hypothetical protein